MKMNMDMKNKSNLWIATLTLSAILMVVVLLSSNERQAQASMMNAQANFSLITAGPPGTDEALIIVDKTSQKLVVFQLVNGNTLTPVSGINLAH